MTKKRANGGGSVYKTKDGRVIGTWLDANGKTRYLTSKTMTKAEMKAAVRKKLQERDEGIVHDLALLLAGEPSGSSIAKPNVARWVHFGLLALPLSGVLTLWTTFIHQPDHNADFEAYARYVSTTSYLVEHLFGSILGLMLAIFGAVALGVYLSSRRSALVGMVTSVAGHILILTILGMSTFATPAVGRAYLEG